MGTLRGQISGIIPKAASVFGGPGSWNASRKEPSSPRAANRSFNADGNASRCAFGTLPLRTAFLSCGTVLLVRCTQGLEPVARLFLDDAPDPVPMIVCPRQLASFPF